MQDILQLQNITWTLLSDDGAAAQSQRLRSLGIAHAFCGRNPTPLARPTNTQHVRQVHGVDLYEYQAAVGGDLPAADGIYTSQHGQAIAVKTADCVPLLLADCDKRMVMAVHAGWRGLTAGIITAAVQHYAKQGIEPKNIVAAIGPAIGLSAFEVGAEVITALHAPASGLSPTQAALSSAKGQSDRWHADLKTAAALILLNANLRPEHIEVLQACTFTAHNTWFSYRRGERGVSNWSWISL